MAANYRSIRWTRHKSIYDLAIGAGIADGLGAGDADAERGAHCTDTAAGASTRNATEAATPRTVIFNLDNIVSQV